MVFASLPCIPRCMTRGLVVQKVVHIVNLLYWQNLCNFYGWISSPGGQILTPYLQKTWCHMQIWPGCDILQHFEHFIGGHFRKYGRDILIGCKAYLGGAQVGCLVGDGVQDVDEGDNSCSRNFKCSLETLFKGLMNEFTNLGVSCHEFQAKIVNSVAEAAADTTLRL